MRSSASRFCAGLLFVVVGVVWGSESADTDREEEALDSELVVEVEVSAARPDAGDVAAFATTIEGDEIAERGQDLADVLRRVPGARVRDYGGLGSYATLSLRASTSEQVTVLVDGVPQNRALGGPVDLSSIPATQIDRITVYRGFGPAALGLGGVGGVVDIRTRAPDETGGRVDAVVGELGTRRLSADVSVGRAESGYLRVGVEMLRSEDDFLFLSSNDTYFTQSDDEELLRANNDRERGAFLIHGLSHVGRGEVKASLRVQRHDQGVPTVENNQSETARIDEELFDLAASWSRRARHTLDEIDLQLNAFGQESRFDDPLGDLGRKTVRTTELGGFGLVGLGRASVGRHGLLFRLEGRGERARVRDDALAPDSDRGGGDRNVATLTFEDVVRLGRWVVAPSVRWQYRQDDFDDSHETVRDDALTGKIGLAYRLGRSASLRGSVGLFHRIPSLLELFGDRGAVIGDPNLRPESGRSIELGATGRGSWGATAWSAEAVAFGRRTEDLIWFVQKSQGVSKAVNLAEAEVAGLELSASLRWRWGFTLDGNGTLQRATDTSGGFPDGNPLPYQPGTLGYLGLSYERRGLRARWEIIHVGQNSVDQKDTKEVRIPAREVHDVNLAYGWAGGMRVGLEVRNLFDTATVDVSRYPLPGRVVLLHVGWHSDARERNP